MISIITGKPHSTNNSSKKLASVDDRNLQNPHSITSFQVISNKNIKIARYFLETICHRPPFLWTNQPRHQTRNFF